MLVEHAGLDTEGLRCTYNPEMQHLLIPSINTTLREMLGTLAVQCPQPDGLSISLMLDGKRVGYIYSTISER